MSDIEYTDEMVEEIIKEIPEGVDEVALAEEKAMEKVSFSKKPKKKFGDSSIFTRFLANHLADKHKDKPQKSRHL